MIQLINVKFYKKLISYFIFYFSLFTSISAFGGVSHFTITQSAYLRTKILNIFDDAQERVNLESSLIKGCQIPDEEESGWVYKSHFYNIVPTFLNKIEDILTTDDNAEKRMYQHYKNGINFYKNGNKIDAFYELGKSLHYLEDMCCPVHLLGWSSIKHNKVDITKFKRIHDLYEEKMDKECGKYLYKLMDSDSRFDFKKVYTLQGIINSYPLKAYDDYENKHKLEPNYEIFKNAHKAACELIYLFFQEVGINL